MRADQRKFHYIYKITRTDGSGKYYIGMHSTNELEDGYFGSGTLLAASIRKHGKEKHIKEILEFLPSRAELKIRERQLVNEDLLGTKQCMNLKLGGEGGGKIWNEEHRRKFVASNSRGGKTKYEKYGNDSWQVTGSSLGGAATIKLNGKLSQTAEAKQKRKDSLKSICHQVGEKNSQFGTCWVTDGVKPIKIKRENLDEYLMNGYSRGRLLRSGAVVARESHKLKVDGSIPSSRIQ